MTEDHSCLSEAEAERAACARTQGALTNEEVAVLAAMRELKQEVRELKKRAREAEQASDDANRAELESRLAAARERWEALDQQREEARHRRMVMLGHLPG